MPNAEETDGEITATMSSLKAQSSTCKTATKSAGPYYSQSILLFLVAFRTVNALTVTTFFQPDEYFQSLEPAWRIVFGDVSGAWITWVSPLN